MNGCIFEHRPIAVGAAFKGAYVLRCEQIPLRGRGQRGCENQDRDYRPDVLRREQLNLTSTQEFARSFRV